MKRRLIGLANAAGLLALWRWWHRDRVIILMVHGVMDESTPHRWRPLRPQLSPARLDECLGILERHYTFVTLGEAVDMLAGRRRARPYSIVLTFDDGYRNQLTHALPVLQRHGVPATIFVSTGHVRSRQPFWFDRLDYALQQAPVDGREVVAGGETMRLSAADRGELAESYARLRRAAKDAERDDREMCRELDALAAALEAQSGRALASIVDDDPWTAVLSIDEVRRAGGGLVTFDSHGVDHLRLHRLDRGAVLAQLRDSRRDLEAWTGRPCRHLCYPDGASSAEAAAIARDCGYVAAVTTRRGLNRVGADPMQLRRMDLPAQGDATALVAAVSGFTDRLLGVRDSVFGRSGRRRRRRGAWRPSSEARQRG
jgi:peptidoglycan/xylan/chitin deacetylase (PgdA/CDA1 family)